MIFIGFIIFYVVKLYFENNNPEKIEQNNQQCIYDELTG